MDQGYQPLRARHWNSVFAPLSLAFYVTWLAIAYEPALRWLQGRLPASAAAIAGSAGLVAVPLLFLARCGIGEADPRGVARARLLVLLQALAALIACWGFIGGGLLSGHSSIPVLLIVVAAQLVVLFPPRTSALLLLAINGALAILLMQNGGWQAAVPALFAYVGFQIFAGFTALYARRAEEARDAAVQINAELTATRQLLLESARGEERLRLSRELHDVVGHKLTALKLQLRLQARRADASPIIAECERLADELLADVRGVVGALREYDGIELRQALAALVPALPQPQVRLELAPEARAPGLAQAQALLRCAQEGLTNALRHSGAAEVVIRLQAEAAGIALSVEDDGRARQLPQPGNGLRGMRERLEALGGRLELALRDSGGLRLHAWLPQSSPVQPSP
jgi:signal transduction histidine kinase